MGGPPAYRREFAQDDTPAGADDFDPWVCRTVLKLFLFSGTGFADALVRRAEADPAIQLVGLNRLYYGS